MTKLFISYSRKDLDPVERFVDQAAQSGLQTWIDYPAIRAGKLWRESIASAILECDFFLLFISSSSVQSESVERELEFAVRNHKRIIPIR